MGSLFSAPTEQITEATIRADAERFLKNHSSRYLNDYGEIYIIYFERDYEARAMRMRLISLQEIRLRFDLPSVCFEQYATIPRDQPNQAAIVENIVSHAIVIAKKLGLMPTPLPQVNEVFA